MATATAVSLPPGFHMQPQLAAAVLTQLQNAPPRGTPRSAKSEPEFNIEDVQKYFNIPAKQAAKKLNIGITKLKLVCRQLGIRRWPYRTLRAASKKPLSKLAARVRKEGILKMIALPSGKLSADGSFSSGSGSDDDSASSAGGSPPSAFSRVVGGAALPAGAVLPTHTVPAAGMLFHDPHLSYLIQRFHEFGRVVYTAPAARPVLLTRSS